MKYLVVGDSMVDVYVLLNSIRTDMGSQAPIVAGESWTKQEKRIEMPGGAANFVAVLKKILKDENCDDTVTFYTNKNTPIKLRLFVDKKNIIRFDSNDQFGYEPGIICNAIQDISNHDVVIVSNYHKGLLQHEDVAEIGRECKKQEKISFVDTNIFNENYLDFNYIKINQKTAEKAIFGDDFPIHMLPSISNLATLLKGKYSKKSEFFCQYSTVIVTLGASGCQVAMAEQSTENHLYQYDNYQFQQPQCSIIDSIGAGDVFFANIIYYLIVRKYDISTVCKLANLAAKEKCVNSIGMLNTLGIEIKSKGDNKCQKKVSV